MRKTLLVSLVSLLLGIAIIGCRAEKMGPKVEEIVKQLNFKLEKIEPKFRAELPIDKSGFDVVLTLGIENPTDTKINAQSFNGKLSFKQGGDLQFLGDVSFNELLTIQPKSKTSFPIMLQFKYSDVVNAWRPIANVAMGHATEWTLAGNLGVKAYGSTHTIPVQLTETTGQSAQGGATPESGGLGGLASAIQDGLSRIAAALVGGQDSASSGAAAPTAATIAPSKEGLAGVIGEGAQVAASLGSAAIGVVGSVLSSALGERGLLKEPDPPAWPTDVKGMEPGLYKENVRVRVTVKTNGSPDNLVVLSGPREFHSAAIDWVKKCIFNVPTRQNGQPISYDHIVTVPFAIEVTKATK